MRRPILLPTLDPTAGEIGVFLLWLVAVVASMAAMILIPPFNLLFWPCLWIYDIVMEEAPVNSLDPVENVGPTSIRATRTLYDREIDG